MTYSLINLVFLVPALALWIVAVAKGRLRLGAGLVAAAILVVLTVVFDNIMIKVGLMVYNDTASSGARIGLMPFEDLAYTVFAALALPALWSLLARGTNGRRKGPRH